MPTDSVATFLSLFHSQPRRRRDPTVIAVCAMQAAASPDPSSTRHPASGKATGDRALTLRDGIECHHVSTPKPLKKRKVLIIADKTVTPIISQESEFLTGTTRAVTSLEQSLSCSRRSSDSGIESPCGRDTGERDAESANMLPNLPSLMSPPLPATHATKGNKSVDGSAKRTPFCGRCRNHDVTVLVKGQSMFQMLI